MAKTIQLSQLSEKDRAKLLNQFKQEEANKEKEIQLKRKGYKTAVNDVIPGLFADLKQASALLSSVKKRVYEGVENLVKTKSEVYDRQDDQTSHSFTTDEGTTISVGYNQTDGWDDTVEIGIAKVKDYINSMAKDANSKNLVNTVLRLLSKDKGGTLKASRVIQLKKLADDTGDPGFIDAIAIIQAAYKPNRTRQFIRCRYKGEKGEAIELPLNITDAEM
jgi:hypothetical protein